MRWIEALCESGIVLVVGLGLGLAMNALDDDGLDLGRNHFPVLSAPSPSDGGAPAGDTAAPSHDADTPRGTEPAPETGTTAATGDAASGEAPSHDAAASPYAPAHVLARLQERGLHALSFEEAQAVFGDPMREYGAYVFIDARQPEPYAAGHIPGAYLFDRYRPERYLAEIQPLLGVAQKIVVYCTGGECEDSEYAADFLIQFGAPTSAVFVYVGGIAEWTARGMPLERGARDSGDLQEEPG